MKTLLLAVFLLATHTVTAQWQSMGAPEGGNVADLAGTPDGVWAGTAAGIFRSTDGGQSWTVMPAVLPGSYAVPKIAADSALVIAALAPPTLPYYLVKSTDDGATWQLLNLPNGQGITIVDLDVAEGVVYLVLSGQLFRSTDGGTTWTLDELANLTTYVKQLQPVDGALYATTFDSVWHLPAGAGAWQPVELPAGNLACFYAQNENLWIAAAGLDGTVYRSIDQGETWEPTFWSTSFTQPPAQILPYNGGMLAVRNFRFVTSTDGVLWQLANANPLPSGAYGPIDELATQGSTIVARHFSGFLRTDAPDQTLAEANTGFSTYGAQALESHDGYVYAAFPQRGFFRKDPASTGDWEFQQSIPIGSTYLEMRRHGAYQFATISYNTHFVRIERTGDGWLSREIVRDEAAALYGPLASTPTSLYTLLTPTSTPYALRTDDLGDNWENITAPLYAESGEFGTAMAWQNDVLLAALSGDVDQFYRSDDHGQTWFPQTATGLSGAGIQRLFGAAGQFFARIGPLFYRSDDNGQTWSFAGNGLPGGSAPFTDLIAANGALLLAVGEQGVYRSLDGGEHWHAFSEGLGLRRVTTLRADSAYVYAGTLHNGVWKRGIGEVVAAPEVPAPWLYVLYPNPVGDYFTVDVAAWRGLSGRLELYDVAGQHRLSSSIEIGKRVELTRAVSPGVYIFRVMTVKGSLGGRFVVGSVSGF
jgi:photosystem II stability/assembly factor-like uncharacterized protein